MAQNDVDTVTTEERERRELTKLILGEISKAQLEGITRQQLTVEGRSRDSVVRQLGKMVVEGQVIENLTINRALKKVRIPGRGLITINVDLLQMRNDYNATRTWEALKQKEISGGISKKEKEKLEDLKNQLPYYVASQEALIDTIITGTRTWLADKVKESGLPPIIIEDLCVLHGARFDILISLLYRREDDFTAFVREVIHRTRHVSATQTAFVAFSKAEAERNKNYPKEKRWF